jgi:hypothetical protein
MTNPWIGFVIDQDDTYATVLTERNKSKVRVKLPVEDGPRMIGEGDDAHMCNIQKTVFNGSKLFSACKSYVYDAERQRRKRVERAQQRIEAKGLGSGKQKPL